MPYRSILVLVAILLTFFPTITMSRTISGGSGYSWRLFVNTHPAPLFYQAAGIAAGTRGDIFVGDRGNDRVQELVLGFK